MLSDPVQIVIAHDPKHYADAATLFSGYALWMHEAFGQTGARDCLVNQSFESELASLPGRYAPPQGAIVLAYVAAHPIGVIAFYPLDSKYAELKRFFVLPEAGGHGIGKALFGAALGHAKTLGYSHVRLDTLAGMVHARKLYDHFGFYHITPYNDVHPHTPDVLYYECDLSLI